MRFETQRTLAISLLVSASIASLAWSSLAASGFCFAKGKYLTDDEFFIKHLTLEWPNEVDRLVSRGPKDLKPHTINEFLARFEVWGAISGRKLKWYRLFTFEYGAGPTMPPQIFRIFGMYSIESVLALQNKYGSRGQDKFRVLARSFDQCGNFTDTGFGMEDNPKPPFWRRIYSLSK